MRKIKNFFAMPNNVDSGALDGDLATVFADRFEGDLDAVLGQEVFDPPGPFDDDDAALVEEFRKTDRLEILRATDAVGVEVVNREAAAGVDVEEDERGAAHAAGGAAEAFDEAADELGFAGSQVSVQGDALATVEGLRQRGRNGFGFGDTV